MHALTMENCKPLSCAAVTLMALLLVSNIKSKADAFSLATHARAGPWKADGQASSLHPGTRAFAPGKISHSCSSRRRLLSQTVRYVSSTTTTEEVAVATSISNEPSDGAIIRQDELQESIVVEKRGLEGILSALEKKIGRIDEDRLLFPEYSSGEVPRMFSTLDYTRCKEGKVTGAVHSEGSVLGAAALVAGTTVGAGVLALPAAGM